MQGNDSVTLLLLSRQELQLTAATGQLSALGLDIPVCGLAKSDEEVFVPWDETPIVLPSGSASLYLIKQVRDESHRFAITFHTSTVLPIGQRISKPSSPVVRVSCLTSPPSSRSTKAQTVSWL